ncbi:hypothetical protein ACFPYI_04330 [Halomarina salina]|uniref:DUF7344 domain-containing protein n=1 Tax=Halomarina salina TaxID=1872699 RepID=A0ABD5RJA1_9EURY|nr:hypothetical protein [Halomarina salina]
MDDWTPDELSEDEAYDLVAEELRRETLRLLLNESEEWDVSSLATEIAARESDISHSEVNEGDQKRVAVALLHRDLPKLADADVVEFDFEDETVVTGEHIDDLDPLL